jgi:malonyl-CoA O-methyltransferase
MALGPGTSALTPTIVNPPRAPLRVDTVRRQFDRRADRIGAHDFIYREVGRRVVERLELMRLQPCRIADVGCGDGAARDALLRRYPRADWIGIDLSLRRLCGVRRAPGWARLAALWRGRPARLVADAGALPLASDSIELLFSNLMLQWHPAPHEVLPEWWRVLRVDGLLMFSSFGPDTLLELRAACAAAGLVARPLAFVDMHDFGDMMIAAGFAAPVMDNERIRLTYATPQALLAEVRALGGNPRDDRAPGLPGGKRARALAAALEAQRDRQGRIGLTFEIAYGHAWKAARTRGESRVSVEALRTQLRRR